jgi:hypothetical protein
MTEPVTDTWLEHVSTDVAHIIVNRERSHTSSFCFLSASLISLTKAIPLRMTTGRNAFASAFYIFYH